MKRDGEPEQMERLSVEIEGESFTYLAAGPDDGPVALCLHGFPDIPRTWAPIVPSLTAAGYRVIAPYMRGYAPSTTRGPFAADRVARDILNLSKALGGGRPVHLLGHDWGAVAVYVACLQAPEAFGRAVTMAVPHPIALFKNMATNPEQIRRSWYMVFMQLRVVPERVVRSGDFWLIERFFREWSPDFDVPADYLAEVKATLAASMPGPIEYYRAIMWPPVEAFRRFSQAYGGRIKVPTLYLHGAEDGCIGPEAAEGQAKFFDAPLEEKTLEGAGHFLQLENPAWVGEQIMQWLGPAGASASQATAEPG